MPRDWVSVEFLCHQPKRKKKGGGGIDTHRVGSDVNSLLLAVLNQVIALEHGVALDLVGGRDNTSAFNESLELRECIS